MNILFFLVPKERVVFLSEDFTVQQTLEKMEDHRYGSVPIINKDGKYVGTLTEGDLLWAIRKQGDNDLNKLENTPIKRIPRKRDNEPVNINCNIEDLVMTSLNQNFVPVIDDNGIFIGIITRKSIIEFYYNSFSKTN